MTIECLTKFCMESLFGKGDTPGHDFHGNQYTGGGGSDNSSGNTHLDHARETVAAMNNGKGPTKEDAKALSEKANASGKPEDHFTAALAHYQFGSQKGGFNQHDKAGDTHWNKAMEGPRAAFEAHLAAKAIAETDSKRADAMSAKAKTPSDHVNASVRHAGAAITNRAAGNEEQAKYHEQKAAEHEAKNVALGGKSSAEREKTYRGSGN